MHKLDPRVKLWGALLGMVTGLATGDFIWLVSGTLVLNLLLLSAGVSFRRLRWIWGAVAPIITLILILQPWFAPSGATLFGIGRIQLTTGGLLSGAHFAARVAFLAFVAAAPLLTTRQDILIQGMVKLGLPYPWGLTITLALHYLPTAYSTFQNIRQAQEVRGWIAGRGNPLKRAASYMPVLIGVVISSLRLADQLAMAMAARGFGSGPRTSLHEIKMRPSDWYAAFMALVIFGLYFAVST